jgi:hypothetical protein
MRRHLGQGPEAQLEDFADASQFVAGDAVEGDLFVKLLRRELGQVSIDGNAGLMGQADG